MDWKLFVNNKVNISGIIVSPFEYSHEVFGEAFYITEVKVERLSKSHDIIPLMISERLIDVTKDYRGKEIEVTGQFRSYNRHEENKNRLVLSVFVREIKICESDYQSEQPNSIFLDGYICKPPIYRKTPLGREITDLLLVVNRSYGKRDYIPCIAWGRNARFSEKFQVGEHIWITGRIQSREYQKKISETEAETRTAYEISVQSISLIKSREEIHDK